MNLLLLWVPVSTGFPVGAKGFRLLGRVLGQVNRLREGMRRRRVRGMSGSQARFSGIVECASVSKHALNAVHCLWMVDGRMNMLWLGVVVRYPSLRLVGRFGDHLVA